MAKRNFNNLESSLEVAIHATAGARKYNVTYRVNHPKFVELGWYLTRDDAHGLTKYVVGIVEQASNDKAELTYGCSYGREIGIGFDTTWQREEYTARTEIIHLAKLVGRVVQTALERKLRTMQTAYPAIVERLTFGPKK